MRLLYITSRLSLGPNEAIEGLPGNAGFCT